VAALLALTAVVVLASWDSLGRREIDGLDEAHHFMDGIFFRDLIADRPFDRLATYPFDYYAQYPALGFTFWPPFYPFVEGWFLLIGGVDLVNARLCMLAFAVALAVLLHLSVRGTAGDLLGALGVGLVMTTPLVANLFNRNMLEIPTLTMALAAVFLYQRVVRRGRWAGFLEAGLMALLLALAVYTKQTIVFLLPALLADLCINHRGFLKQRLTWVAVILFAVLCVPLGLFTLKFGYVNIAQSVGNEGGIYVAGHKGPSRWSLDGWTYYGRLLPDVVQPALCALLALALAYGMCRRSFLRQNGVWLFWVLAWYLTFSYLDNKQPRFVAFLVPAVVLLGINLAARLTEGNRLGHAVWAMAAAALLAVQGVGVMEAPRSGYWGMDNIVADVLARDGKGNILYFGEHRQFFVPSVRMLDESRRVHVLQGHLAVREKSTGKRDLPAACRDFRVRWVFLEQDYSGRKGGRAIRRQLSRRRFRLFREGTFAGPGGDRTLLIYEYQGPHRKTMSEVPVRGRMSEKFDQTR
jgi:hypothetical protein